MRGKKSWKETNCLLFDWKWIRFLITPETVSNQSSSSSSSLTPPTADDGLMHCLNITLNCWGGGGNKLYNGVNIKHLSDRFAQIILIIFYIHSFKKTALLQSDGHRHPVVMCQSSSSSSLTPPTADDWHITTGSIHSQSKQTVWWNNLIISISWWTSLTIYWLLIKILAAVDHFSFYLLVLAFIYLFVCLIWINFEFDPTQ